nr:NADPH-dependent FMN reductase [Devosia submarina]
MAFQLKIIIGSTRPGRVGPAVAHWVKQVADQHDGFEVELVDLADLALPLLDEPGHPMMRKYEHEHSKKWSRIVSTADAFVFVTPEYDYFPPASLVNAIQYLAFEWFEKPAAVVSYGGVSGGLRSAQVLRSLLGNLHVVTLTPTLPLPFVQQMIDDKGTFTPTDEAVQGANAMFNQLQRWTGGLKNMREHIVA